MSDNDKRSRILAEVNLQLYFENADFSDIQENADYHARKVLAILEPFMKFREVERE